MIRIQYRAFFFILSLALLSCGTTRPAPRPTPVRPGTTTPGTKPTPTRPSGTDTPVKPNPGNPTVPLPGKNDNKSKSSPDLYRVAVLLPFLTKETNIELDGAAGKSELALQYYGGMQLAFQDISASGIYPHLTVDVLDTQASDGDFKQLLTDSRLKRAQIIIGPVRNSHITLLAEQTKSTNQIVISPESPASELTTSNPGFIQTTPALRAHCARIVQYLRKEKKYLPSQIVLVGKEKESDRFSYFQEVNQNMGGATLTEVIVPDAATNFDKIDLKRYLRPGQTTAFVVPSWAGQDWIMAFLSRLKAVKGQNKVEVFGMPQWVDYELLDPDLLEALQVHISASGYIDRTSAEVQDFERRFYEIFGTLPDDNAYNGYDVVRFMADMLHQYGLSFPEKAGAASSFYATLRGGFYLRQVKGDHPLDSRDYDYVENIYVQILRYSRFAFRPITE